VVVAAVVIVVAEVLVDRRVLVLVREAAEVVVGE
jgi:hypothetical protein